MSKDQTFQPQPVVDTNGPQQRKHLGGITREAENARLTEVEKLWAVKNRNRAMVLAADLYEDAPGNARVANFYGWCLLDRRDYVKALEVTEQSFERFGTAQFLNRLCLIYADLKREPEALLLTEKLFSNPELQAFALLCHGALIVKAERKLDSAIDFFHRAARAGDLKADTTPARLSMRTHEFETFTALEANRVGRAITFCDPAASASAVVAVTGDEPYYRALFEIYRNSFFEHSKQKGHILHAHIFDPSADFLKEMMVLKADFDGRLRISYEHSDKSNRSYYYVGRFVQIPELIAHYECPVFVTDLDCYFRGSIDAMLQRTSNADIGIVELQKRLTPWRNFLGGFVAFNPTEAARRHAVGIRNFLLSLPPDTNYWYIDQLALMESAYLARQTGVGRLEVVTDDWRLLCEQGTGTTGEPEAKAKRIKDRMMSRQRQAVTRERNL